MAFGSFDGLCNSTALPLCLVVASVNATSYFGRGIVPECYCRPVEIANTMIFNVGTAFLHIGALGVFLIIIFNVRAKYTAIGRSEMLYFFYVNIGLTISSLIVDCGVLPPSLQLYAYFVALQLAFALAVCISLLYNGLVCFQLWEDGTRRLMWVLRAVSAAWFIVAFIVLIVTFKLWHTLLNDHNTTALMTVTYVLNAIILAVYVASQLLLVFFALDLYWHLGAIVLFCFFFVAGQVLAYVFGKQICEKTKHYVDGLFFATACNLFAEMMVYKFWDMITADTIEFSVANMEHGVTAFGDEKRQSQLFY